MTTEELIAKSDAVLTAQREAVGRLISWTLSGFGVGVVVFTVLRLVPHRWALPFALFWFGGIILHALRDINTGRTPAGLFSLTINLAMWVFVAVGVGIALPLPEADVWYPLWLMIWCALLVLPCLLYVRTTHTATKQFDLKCPRCHTPLLPMRAVVIASRNCGRCGSRVLEENAPSLDAPNARLTIGNRARRRQRVAFYLSLAITAVSVYLLWSLSSTNYVVPITSDGRPPGRKIGPTKPVATVPSASYLTVSLDSTWAETKQPNDGRRTHFGPVAQQVVRAMETLFQGRKAPDRRPIIISQRKSSDFVSVRAKPEARKIYVYFDTNFAKELIRDRNYARFAFLLSYSLGHVVLNPRRDDILMEILAAAAALETCERLTDTYPEWDLPQEWQEYGANYKAFSNRVVRAVIKRTPAGVAKLIQQGRWEAVTRYLIKYQHKANATRVSGERWPWVLLEAITLRSQPVPWPELVDFAARTPTDNRRISPDLRKALARIGRSPGMKPKTASQTEAR